jgi:hypothetical protein
MRATRGRVRSSRSEVAAMHVRVVPSFAIGVALVSAGVARPQPVLASAQPVCSATRIVRIGTANTIDSQANGGYTRFVSSGGGTYGVDPNSIPEDLFRLLKPNGAAVRVTVAGRTCDDKIFYIERVEKPIVTALRPYTPSLGVARKRFRRRTR